MRTITKVYQDPLDVIWLQTASALGIHVVRSDEVFASWNGAGVLTIGTAATLDIDDSLAQMILHEICHLLVEGPSAMRLADWGIGGGDVGGRVREHACLRVQAALADTVGMRAFFAATTVFRKYYDALEADPLVPADDPAVVLATPAWQQSRRDPWQAALDRALRLSAAIESIVSEIAPTNSVWSRT